MNSTQNSVSDAGPPATAPKPLSRFKKFPFATALSCLIMLTIFAGIHASGTETDLEEELLVWGYVSAYDIWQNHYWWGLVTSVFLHLEPLHLLLNVYWIWVLGTPIEKVFGAGKWVLFLLTAGAVSSAAQLAHTDSTGIGASGVAYAFFGLIWFGRKRYPGLNGVLDRKLIFIFLFWLLICSFNPDIGNAAHLAGLFFGSAIGAALIYPGIRSRMAWAFCVTLLTATFLILLWCPWSSDWNAANAYNAHSSGDFSTAIRYYRKTIDIDDSSYNAAWAWNNLADISEFNGDVKAAEHARQMALKLENMNPGSSD